MKRSNDKLVTQQYYPERAISKIVDSRAILMPQTDMCLQLQNIFTTNNFSLAIDDALRGCTDSTKSQADEWTIINNVCGA